MSVEDIHPLKNRGVQIASIEGVLFYETSALDSNQKTAAILTNARTFQGQLPECNAVF
jgi:hypothetical protein